MTFVSPLRATMCLAWVELSSSIYRYVISHVDYLITHPVTLAFDPHALLRPKVLGSLPTGRAASLVVLRERLRL